MRRTSKATARWIEQTYQCRGCYARVPAVDNRWRCPSCAVKALWRVPLGQVVATPAALTLMAAHGVNGAELLDRHVRGDWGDVGAEDAAENDWSLEHGERLLSSYGNGTACHLWVITERDRSVTTILRPQDY